MRAARAKQTVCYNRAFQPEIMQRSESCLKAVVFAAVLGAVLAAVAGCGGSTSGAAPPPVTGLKKRALVSNSFAGALLIIDAAHDQCVLRGQTVPCNGAPFISVGAQPGPMAVSSDLSTTVVFSRGTFSVAVVNNKTEQRAGSVALPDFTDMLLISSDGKTAWAPVRNANVGAGIPLGALAVIDTTAGTETNVNIPAARRAFLSHNGKTIIVLPDTTADPSVTNSIWIYDTSAKTVTGPIGGFDHPAWAVFSSDDSTAYILDCGPECGGSTAGVSAVTLSAPAGGTITPVPGGATVGLLNSSTLFVAGNAGNTGTLTEVGVSGATLTPGATASISDGYHSSMALGANGKLFVGATTCTNAAKSCLTIYDTAGKTAKDVFNTAQPNQGDVTGLQPISNRSVVYVIEGGELRIYDTTTDALTANQLDIVGQAVDVKQIDP